MKPIPYRNNKTGNLAYLNEIALLYIGTNSPIPCAIYCSVQHEFDQIVRPMTEFQSMYTELPREDALDYSERINDSKVITLGALQLLKEHRLKPDSAALIAAYQRHKDGL